MRKPLVIELYSGLHGWGEGFTAEGFRSVGFDIVDMCRQLGVTRPPDCELVLQDVLTLHGSQFRDAACIVASPPCQKYSYMAMPWTRAKREIRWQEWERDSPFGDFRLNDLFDACFRIQREASEAAGRHIPLVVENVKGAQPWVGPAQAKYGPFYLWGDVPPLIPYGKPRKQEGDPSWFYENYAESARRFSSHSKERRQWSATIAKIPLEIAQWIAQCFKPTCSPAQQQENGIWESPNNRSQHGSISMPTTAENALTNRRSTQP